MEDSKQLEFEVLINYSSCISCNTVVNNLFGTLML